MEDRVLARLERCERANRRLRSAVLLMLPLPLVVAWVGHARLDGEGRDVVETLQVRELVVVDSQDVVRVRLGGTLPDAVIDGRPVPRGEQAAGVLLYDDTGRERGGYVTFTPSGNVALTLDTRERQVALFAADPADGAVARIGRADGSDWVEMRAGPSGAHFHAGRARELVFQEPPMMQGEAAAFCSDFMAEVNQAAPPLPKEQVLGACRQYMPEEECQECVRAR
jgi:hypothetical protein